MQKIKILGFPGNGILSNSFFLKVCFANNENIPFPMGECVRFAERQRKVFPASLTDMVINRTSDTITVFEDGKNETISMQWCEVSELSDEYLQNHSHTTIELS